MWSKRALSLLLAAAVITASGCTVIRHNELPLVTSDLTQQRLAPKPKVFFSWQAVKDVEKPRKNYGDYVVYEGLFRQALDNSDCCEIVSVEEDADFIIDGFAETNYDPVVGWYGFFNTVLLNLIPYWDNRTATMRVVVRDQSKELKTYRLDDSVSRVYWLPLIVFSAYPPHWFHVHSAEKRMFQNAYSNLLYRMKRDGVLKASPQTCQPGEIAC